MDNCDELHPDQEVEINRTDKGSKGRNRRCPQVCREACFRVKNSGACISHKDKEKYDRRMNQAMEL